MNGSETVLVTESKGQSPKKIKISVKGESKFIYYFLGGTVLATIISLYVLHVNWLQLAARSGDIFQLFWKMAHFSMKGIDFTLLSFADTFSIMVLATIYSIGVGLVFGLCAAENIHSQRWICLGIKGFFTFLRAVPTPVWVVGLSIICYT